MPALNSWVVPIPGPKPSTNTDYVAATSVKEIDSNVRGRAIHQNYSADESQAG
jgi:hypothetical protein